MRGHSGLYSGWRRERFGPFAGLSGWQAAGLAVAWLPPLAAVGRSHWTGAAQLGTASLVLTALVVVPVRRRPAARWLLDGLLFATGRALGWSAFRPRVATGAGTTARLDEPDLPGIAAVLRFHDGPPPPLPGGGPVAVIQDPNAGRWSATAAVTHPGLGNADTETREGWAAQLGGLLAAAAATEEVCRVSVQIRTVPDDGAQRAAWVADRRRGDAPPAVVAATDQLETLMRSTAVRHELFVTVGVTESRIRRAAKDAGGGVTGRARILYRHLAEVEAQLRGLGATGVSWLSTPDLAAAIRTGYNPADAVPLQRARQEHARGAATVLGPPLAAAGPSGAPPPAPRAYTHDGFTSVSYALLLPELPTRVGALTRLLAVARAGERRTLTLHYEPISAGRAGRQVEHDLWAAEIAADVRTKRGFRVGRRERRLAAETAAHEQQLAAGHTMVRLAGVAAVTVPSGWDVEDHAAALEAAARACGYGLLRLDLAQDAGFVAGALPLGVGLPGRDTRC
ncbi:MAG TPA: SCO6880 family protein [Dermatophilaceae bacterium]|nr:SCO6880 family protein [Dermatophilaceae bacterium]